MKRKTGTRLENSHWKYLARYNVWLTISRQRK
jgi:hypothetical protein